MHQFTKTLLAAGLALGAIAAQAAPVITWSYNVSSIWSSAGPAAPGVSDGVTISPDQLTLSWPTGDSSQSSLVISGANADGSQSGSVDTYIGGPPVPTVAPYAGLGNSLTHNNFVISGSSLQNATLQATLQLTATDPSGGPALPSGTPSPLNVSIGFSETNNTAGACLVTGSPIPCNDIFVLTGGLLNQSFFYDVGTGDQEYFVNVFPIAGGVLSTLPDDVCLDAGGDPTKTDGCIGFTTPERDSTTLQFAFTISTQPLSLVPEPGTLALAGLALLGAGLVRRRIARKA